jgi:membrane-associated phospholipid phosphatase
MPSGDAFQSALYVVFLHFLGLPLWGLVCFHVLVCVSRVYYMCHWVADTMVSSLIGVLIAKLLLCSELSLFLGSIPEALF